MAGAATAMAASVPAGWRRRLVADLSDDVFVSIVRMGVLAHLRDMFEKLQAQLELAGYPAPFRPIAGYLMLGPLGSWRVAHIRTAAAFLIGAVYYCGSHALFGRFIGMKLAGVRAVGSRSGMSLRWFRVLARYTVQELCLAAGNKWRWWPAVDFAFLMYFRGTQYLHDIVSFTEIVV